jgi:hypothetical protein
MKYFALILSLFSIKLIGQVTVNQSDMPSAGDTIRYSVAANAVTIQPGNGGQNQVWDFTSLTSSSQYIDEFLPINSTPFTYIFAFGPFGASCDMGRLDNSAFQLPAIQGISISDVYNFYKVNGSSFSQKGFGASISGFPVPIPYSSSDVLFPLPMTSSSANSSVYSYEISIPSLGYYGREATRSNEVDGYGLLKTPFGEFETLRLRSVLVSNDTIAIDTLGFGFDVPAQTEVRYKWVAPNYGWPILEITATELFGAEIITRVVYRDRPPVTEPNSIDVINESSVLLYPNPASEIIIVNSHLTKSSDIRYQLFDAMGKKVFDLNRKKANAGENIEFIPLTALNLTNGIYFLQISPEGQSPIYKSVVLDNQK